MEIVFYCRNASAKVTAGQPNGDEARPQIFLECGDESPHSKSRPTAIFFFLLASQGV